MSMSTSTKLALSYIAKNVRDETLQETLAALASNDILWLEAGTRSTLNDGRRRAEDVVARMQAELARLRLSSRIVMSPRGIIDPHGSRFWLQIAMQQDPQVWTQLRLGVQWDARAEPVTQSLLVYRKAGQVQGTSKDISVSEAMTFLRTTFFWLISRQRA